MDTPAQARAAAVDREKLLRDELATCADGCPHRRVCPSTCPLHEVRKQPPAAVLEFLDQLGGEARDYLTLYQQCGLVISYDSGRFGEPPQARPAATPSPLPLPSEPVAPIAPPPKRETFGEAFCRRQGCAPAEFNRAAFLAACYPAARWWARWGGYHADQFVLDRALVAYCGTLRSLDEIDSELREYASFRENQKFLRRVLRLRVSGRRLRALAAACLAS